MEQMAASRIPIFSSLQYWIEEMAFKSVDSILQPDPRFAHLCFVENGAARPMTLADHHSALAGITLSDLVPEEVQAAFDRARNAIIYAFFDYDLFVVGEVQAFGAFELALKHRLNGRGNASRGTLRNLVDRARKAEVLPSITPSTDGSIDPIEALIVLRNELSHGTSDIHSPGMALQVIEACAFWINHVCSPQSG
ncbi:hypothetical protein PQQ75_32270 [Paraburkholderia aspalathi]|uniref:hypothetical protein n=1 Tax=Paraburkholderia aspalathi TaxID=1324617 RepID=UPI0038BBAA80